MNKVIILCDRCLSPISHPINKPINDNQKFTLCVKCATELIKKIYGYGGRKQ